MEKFKVSFSADNQQLRALGTKHASDTYADIEATFVLGERWTDMDSVSAVWWNDFTKVATVLDSQGKCIVPHEVLTRKGCVRVNLVGSIVEGNELVTRLTSYSAEAVQVNEKIKLTGNETSEITPSQYEQFVANVKADADRAEAGADEAEASAQSASESATASAQSASDSQGYAQDAYNSSVTAENAKDDAEDARDEILGMRATAETLEAGSDATASYSDGLLTLGIPRGDKGEQGIQGETGATPNLTIGTVETLAPTEDATATITGTAENPVLNLGVPKGDTGEVSLEDLESLLPTDTASGEIVTIPDGQSVIPAESLKVALEPIQSGSGTPSPDNVRPISGHTEVNTQRTGVNVWDEEWEMGYIKPSDGQNDSSNSNIRSKNYISVIPNTTYYARTRTSAGADGIKMFYYNVNKQYLSCDDGYQHNTSFVTPSDCYYVRFYRNAQGGTTYNNDISINYPSTDTDYHAYNGETYTTSLGRTVYGGTLDVVSGELVVDRVMFTLTGNENWGLLSGYPNACIWNTQTAMMSSFTNRSKVMSSHYLVEGSGGGWGNLSSGHFMIAGSTFIGIGATSAEDLKAYLASQYSSGTPVQIVGLLATPQTIQLTPQEVELLTGTNNVWSDGNVTLVYNADIQRYIEKKLNENSTNSMLTMSRPMTAKRTDAESESVDTNSVDTAQVGDDL